MTMPDQPCTDDYVERAQSFVDAFTDHAIFRVSTAGVVESWSAGSERIKGYRADEIIGKPFSLLYPEEDREAGIPERNLETAARFGHFEENGWRVRKDGSRFRAHVAIAPVRNARKEIVGFAKITRDVSAKHELEAVVKTLATSQQVFEAQKLELMGRLTGGVAHDFNNILAAILSSLEFITCTLPDGQLRPVVQSGIAAALRGRKLVSQLLAFARNDSLAPQPTDLNDFVAELRPLIEQAIGRSASVTLELGASACWVKVDQVHLQSAILNIIMNAKAVTPEGGRIAIRTFNHDVRSRAGLATGQDETPMSALEIQDFGCGMSEEVRARSIEPFFTTKPVGQGNGLGLSQVHGFTKQSGGDLEIDSEVGKGTTVRLLLPACSDRETGQEGGFRATSILIVEDDEELLEISASILSFWGYSVRSALDASQALDIIEGTGQLDLLFTDIVIPGKVDGLELARRATKLKPDLKILLTSGYATAETLAKLSPAERRSFLQKPYRLEALYRGLRRALDGMDVREASPFALE